MPFQATIRERVQHTHQFQTSFYRFGISETVPICRSIFRTNLVWTTVERVRPLRLTQKQKTLVPSLLATSLQPRDPDKG